jgi:hypothetical protein
VVGVHRLHPAHVFPVRAEFRFSAFRTALSCSRLAAPVCLHLDACHQQASSRIGVTDEFGHHDPSMKQAAEYITGTLDILLGLTIMRASQEEVLRMVNASSDHTA